MFFGRPDPGALLTGLREAAGLDTRADHRIPRPDRASGGRGLRPGSPDSGHRNRFRCCPCRFRRSSLRLGVATTLPRTLHRNFRGSRSALLRDGARYVREGPRERRRRSSGRHRSRWGRHRPRLGDLRDRRCGDTRELNLCRSPSRAFHPAGTAVSPADASSLYETDHITGASQDAARRKTWHSEPAHSPLRTPRRRRAPARKFEKSKAAAPPARFARGWHCLGLSNTYRDGQPHQIEAFGTSLVVFADSKGDIKILDAYCRHMGGNLAHGTVKGDSIALPVPRLALGVGNGKCTAIPYARRVPPLAKTRAWITLEKNGQLFVLARSPGKSPARRGHDPRHRGLRKR